MKGYLLDTHIVLNMLLAPEKLTNKQMAVLQDRTSKKYVSAISLWEIALKYSLGKLDLKNSSPEKILLECQKLGLDFLLVTPEIASTYDQLPRYQDHKDPFDRMLVVQAIKSDMVLLSGDARIFQYVEVGLKLA